MGRGAAGRALAGPISGRAGVIGRGEGCAGMVEVPTLARYSGLRRLTGRSYVALYFTARRRHRFSPPRGRNPAAIPTRGGRAALCSAAARILASPHGEPPTMCPASPPVGLLAVVPGLVSRDMIQAQPSSPSGGLTTGIQAQFGPEPMRSPWFNGHMAVIEFFYNGFATALLECLCGPKGVPNG